MLLIGSLQLLGLGVHIQGLFLPSIACLAALRMFHDWRALSSMTPTRQLDAIEGLHSFSPAETQILAVQA